MPPKRGKKYTSITALPGGSELEALAWGYHTAKGVRGDRIAAAANNSTVELLSGTGRAEWGVHIPDLGVQLPASRQTVLDSVGEARLSAAFASSGRRKAPYDPLNVYDQEQALRALSGAKNSRSAFGTGSTAFPDGSILTKAKSFKEPSRREPLRRREPAPVKHKIPVASQAGRVAIPEVDPEVIQGAPPASLSNEELFALLSLEPP